MDLNEGRGFMTGPRKCMDEFAVDDAADGETVVHVEDILLSATGPELAAENKCAYNKHKDLAPASVKPVQRRSILIARSFDPADKDAERVAEELIKKGYRTLADLMYRSKAELTVDLQLDEKLVEAYAEGLKKFYFYLPDQTR